MQQGHIWLLLVLFGSLACQPRPASADQADQVPDPMGHLQQRIEEAMKASRDWARAGRLCEIARECMDLGLVGKAGEVASLARQAAGAIKENDWRSRARVFAQLAGTYEMLGRKEQSEKMLSLALEAAGGSWQPRVQARMLIKVASLYAQAGTRKRASAILEKALARAEKMEDESRQPRLFGAVAVAHLKLGNERGVEEVVKRIVAARNRLMHEKVYRARDKGDMALEDISRAYAGRGQYDEAAGVAEKMRISHLRRRMLARILSGRVSALSKDGRYETALKLVRSAPPERASRARNTLVKEAIDAGRLDIAEEIAPPRRLIRAYARTGQHARALRIVKQVEHAGERSDALAALARGCAERRDYDRAVHAVSEMHSARADEKAKLFRELALMRMDITREREKEFRPVVAGDLAEKRTPAGLRMLARGAEASGQIQGAPIRTHTLLRIAGTYLRLGATENACRLLDLASEAAGGIYPPYFRSLAYVWIADHHMSAKKTRAAARALETAQRTAELIQDAEYRVRGLLRVGRKQLEAGQKKKAKEALSQAAEVAEDIQENYLQADMQEKIQEAMPVE